MNAPKTSPGYDVVVVGAGIAGTLAARKLARAGARVLLVEKAAFPRYKVCGCCLNPRAVAHLEAEGLGHLLRNTGAVPLRQLHIVAGGRAAALPLAGGFAVSRARLDAALAHEAARSGVCLLSGVKARLGEIHGGERTVLLDTTDHQDRVQTRLVLAADGLQGSLMRQATPETGQIAAHSRIGAGAVATDFPEFYRPGVIYMACGKGGYCGLVVLEDGKLDLAAALDAEAARTAGSLSRLVRGILEQGGLPAPHDLDALAWRGTPPLTRRARRLSAEGVLALGDAAGYIEPFTGEGMAWAMASARAVAPLILETLHGRALYGTDLETRWRMVHAQSVATRQWPCRLLAQILRRPRLVRAGVVMLAARPGLAAPVLRYINAARPSPHFTIPRKEGAT